MSEPFQSSKIWVRDGGTARERGRWAGGSIWKGERTTGEDRMDAAEVVQFSRCGMTLETEVIRCGPDNETGGIIWKPVLSLQTDRKTFILASVTRLLKQNAPGNPSPCSSFTIRVVS